MSQKRPNVVFFFTDDQRFDTIAALGNKAIHTPNLDRLVYRGTSFTRAHIPSGSVGAVCMPSRAMLHTGRTLFHLQGAGEQIPAEHTTMGEAFRAAGYRTFGTGKWHNGRAAFQRSFSDGDEIMFGGMADHWNVPVYHYDPSGNYDVVIPEVRDPRHSNDVTFMECDHINAGLHSSQMVCDAALRFINNHIGSGREEPFFAYISFLAPHDPRTMPQEFLDMYDPAQIELPPNFAGGHPFNNGHLKGRDERLIDWPRNPDVVKRHIAEYYGMISHLDSQLGRVLNAIDAAGIADNTIVVFASDNGLAVGQHGLMGKQNCYDHSVRVPLIFAGPGVPDAEQDNSFVYLLDIFPTLCDLAGIDIPASVEGKSMAPLLWDRTAKGRETLYFAFRGFQRGVRNERYKLIEYVVNGVHNMTQLFDLYCDPYETCNLADDTFYSDLIKELRTEMVRYSYEWNDRDSEWGRMFWPVFDKSVSL